MSRTAHHTRRVRYRGVTLTSLRYDKHVKRAERRRFGRAAGVTRVTRTLTMTRGARPYFAAEAIAEWIKPATRRDRTRQRDVLHALRGTANAAARAARDAHWIEELDETDILPRHHRHSAHWDC